MLIILASWPTKKARTIGSKKIKEESLSNGVENVIMLTARMMRTHIIALISMFLI